MLQQCAPPAGVLGRRRFTPAAFNHGNQLPADYNFVPRLPSITVPTAIHYGAVIFGVLAMMRNWQRTFPVPR